MWRGRNFSPEVPKSVRGVREFIRDSSGPANILEHELVKGGEKVMERPTEGQEERAATEPMRFALDMQGMPTEQLVARAGQLSSAISIVCCGAAAEEVLRQPVEQPAQPG